MSLHYSLLPCMLLLFIGTPSARSLTGPTWWQPTPDLNFHYQLGQLIKNLPSDLQPASANVTVYGVDGFDTDKAVVVGMAARGLKVICYFSAGSREDWRPDASQFPASALGNNLDGWAGEKWLDIRDTTVRSIMKARMQMCKDKGFAAVDPDNVDGYTNNPGFPFTAADQINYNKFLAATAHSLGLAIGLKNDVNQLPQLVASFDFAVNEQCWKYNECSTYSPTFISAAKPVWNIEYSPGNAQFKSSVCPKAAALRIKTVKQNMNLDKFRLPCPGA